MACFRLAEVSRAPHGESSCRDEAAEEGSAASLSARRQQQSSNGRREGLEHAVESRHLHHRKPHNFASSHWSLRGNESLEWAHVRVRAQLEGKPRGEGLQPLRLRPLPPKPWHRKEALSHDDAEEAAQAEHL